jgi:hypothetical protein
MRKKALDFQFLTVMLFMVAIPCIYGCRAPLAPSTAPVSATPDPATTGAPPGTTETEKPAPASSESGEICMIPEDHAGYCPEMCAVCHKLASLSKSHENVRGDECMECHRFTD